MKGSGGEWRGVEGSGGEWRGVEWSGVEWSGGVGWVCPLPPTTDFDINGFQWLHQQIVHFHDLFRVFLLHHSPFFGKEFLILVKNHVLASDRLVARMLRSLKSFACLWVLISFQ